MDQLEIKGVGISQSQTPQNVPIVTELLLRAAINKKEISSSSTVVVYWFKTTTNILSWITTTCMKELRENNILLRTQKFKLKNKTENHETKR